MKGVYWLVALVLILSVWCGPKANKAPETSVPVRPEAVEKPREGMVLSSPGFEQGKEIPKRYTGDGEDVSPELVWNNVPEGARSFVLICSDPDAPVRTFIHWVIYNIPAESTRLAEGVPPDNEVAGGIRQGINDFRRIGYNGPKPPPGKPHRYFFRLYALDTVLDLEPGASAGKLAEAMAGHILAQAELMGIYGR